MVPLLNKLRDEADDALSDEQILNVIRGSDEKVVGTAEIAEELPVTQDWTNTKLNELETKGRVHSKSAGSGRVWWLDEAEPDHHVAESVGDLMWYASRADHTATHVWLMSLGLFVVGGLLTIYITLIDVYPTVAIVPFSSEDFAKAAIYAALEGGLFLIAGSILKLVTIGIQRSYTT